VAPGLGPDLGSKDMEFSDHEMEIRIDIEDELAAANTEELQDLALTAANPETIRQQPKIDSKVLIKGTAINKARALKNFSKYRKHTGSTDCLKRVQSVARYSNTENLSAMSSANDITHVQVDDSQKIIISDPIVSLLRIGDDLWLCIGEVNGLRVDGQPVDYIGFEMLGEETVKVSYQMLGLRPASLVDDPNGIHDWRTYAMEEHSFTVPGQLVQSINPATSNAALSMPFYLLQSTVLIALAASLFQSLTVSDLKNVPKIALLKEYPYHEASGKLSKNYEVDAVFEYSPLFLHFILQEVLVLFAKATKIWKKLDQQQLLTACDAHQLLAWILPMDSGSFST
jgi:hypothetical protein